MKTSTAPVARLAFSVLARRGFTLPSMRITHSERAASASA
jgi:hypothetical protein